MVITKKMLALVVVLTAALSMGSAVALNSTVFAHSGPRGPVGLTFDRAGYVAGIKCSDNPLRMRNIPGCSRLHYDK